ncbi:MAG: Na/Pi cotransporter family protein [Myxococcales bacterium FL481]|nr:MAG: Na/Pi cotransporter family protein [Myxococcales bacterium FL481]
MVRAGGGLGAVVGSGRGPTRGVGCRRRARRSRGAMKTPSRRPRASFRAGLRWALALLVLAYVVTDLGRSYIATGPGETAPSAVAWRPASAAIVAEVETTRVSPGGALVVQIAFPDRAASHGPPEAVLEGRPLELLYRRDDQYVFRIPRDVRPGSAALTLRRGDSRSGHYKVDIGPAKRRKFVRNLVGGVALILLGLRTLSRGLRRYIGMGLRRQLARVTSSRLGGLGLGIVAGGVLQATTSAAGMLMGLLHANALSLFAAFAVLMGAQLGAGVTGALLPLAGGREGLLIVALGVGWLMLVNDRRQRGLAELVLGLGLLFHGLQLVRVGASTLVDDPEILAYLRYLNVDTVAGLVACVLAGTLLTALLQGPGPSFVLVLGLAESSGLLTVDQCLAILGGVPLGAALGTVAVASAFGRRGARLARLHVGFGVAATVLLAATVPVWAGGAEWILATDPHEIAWGKKLLYPNVGAHLTLAFVSSQSIVTLLALPLIPLFARRFEARAVEAAPPRREDASQRLRAALGVQRRALASCLALSLTGERHDGSVAERDLRQARDAIEALLRDASPTVDSPLTRVSTPALALALLQLQGTIEALLVVADRGVERAITMSDRDREQTERVHGLVLEAIDALDSGIDTGEVDQAEARRREIRINGIESEVRRQLADGASQGQAWQRALLVSELVGAYESVGNHLFRVMESLHDDPDDF